MMPKLKVVNTWGIGNFRQTAGFPYKKDGNKYHFVCPLGSCIVIWDIENKKVVKSAQIHSDAIACLLNCEAKGLILSLSYSGEGKILREDLGCICTFNTPSSNVVYANWNEDGSFFCICTTGQYSAVHLYEQSKDGKVNTLLWSKYASDSGSHRAKPEQIERPCMQENATEIEVQIDGAAGTSDDDTEKPIKSTSSNNDHIWKCYYGCVFTNAGNIFTVFKEKGESCMAHLFSRAGIILAKTILSPLGERDTSMVCMSGCLKNKVAVGLRMGIFVFVDCLSLEMASVFQTRGAAQVCLWDNEALLTASYQSGQLQWWSDKGVLLNELTITPIESVVHLNWSIPGKELWIGGIPSLNYVCIDDDFKAKGQLTLVQHRVAGCGVSFEECNLVASGDLAGNVILSNVFESMDIFHPEMKTNVTTSVRSLCWLENILLIGTLSGELFSWEAKKNETANRKLLFHFGNSVLTVKKSCLENTFAVGTGDGKVYVFCYDGGELDLKLEVLAHPSKPVDSEIESRIMEIWSVAWDPSDRFLATASEDMTTVVLDSSHGHKITTLSGHTMAVTSVDWKQTSDRCILATCSDDRTVRLHDGISFQLMTVLQTENIEGWYTLTYLAINPIQNMILCSTQNGYLIGWDYVNMKCSMCWRVHSGSIEGLSWDKAFETFATIGADCVVNVFKIDDSKTG